MHVERARHLRFDISNTDHVITVGLNDRVKIVCPSPSKESYEYSKIYAVSSEDYEGCVVSNGRLIGVCKDRNKQSTITFAFRNQSPVPGALTFESGKSYYFISTSNGTKEGINNTYDGLCKTKHMKLKLEVISGNLSQSLHHDTSKTSSQVEMPTSLFYVIHSSDSLFGQDNDDDGSAQMTGINYLLILFVVLLSLQFWW
uniref:Ephrin RBD domain-containing protein n=1 Tax=Syphacia muris TaxID=451379 RepID=A0A158R614_9BILA